MRVFIVHAHPEKKSFNGALTATAVEALQAAGHEVQVSDLHAMGFNPVSDRRNFTRSTTRTTSSRNWRRCTPSITTALLRTSRRSRRSWSGAMP